MKQLTNESITQLNDGFHLIKFWAEWCKPCKVYKPIFELAEKRFAKLYPKVSWWSCNSDIVNYNTALNVKILPTTILLHNGKELGRIVGVANLSMIQKMIEQTKNLMCYNFKN